LGRRDYKDIFGLPDQCQGSLNFFAARIIHARPPSEMDYDFRKHWKTRRDRRGENPYETDT
jgi:hypothetical protein